MADRTVDLLDANLLIALVVEEHVHHEPAEGWMASRTRPFATCPMTQGALGRFLVREGASGPAAQSLLGDLMRHRRHRPWSDDVSFDEIDLTMVAGHKQVTGAYLAGLARVHRARLATLDGGLAAVHPDVVDLVPT